MRHFVAAKPRSRPSNNAGYRASSDGGSRRRPFVLLPMGLSQPADVVFLPMVQAGLGGTNGECLWGRVVCLVLRPQQLLTEHERQQADNTHGIVQGTMMGARDSLARELAGFCHAHFLSDLLRLRE